jgi:hypothetical protein
MASIPDTIDDVTPAWLRDATGLPCEDVEPTQIGVGVGVSSALYRVALRGGGCPSSVIVKLPALDEAAVFTSTVLRMYIREVAFFERLAAEVPVRVPALHYGAVDPDTSRFVVVMEDMAGMRIIDQLEGMTIEDTEVAVDALAAWHATWWRKADHLADEGVAVSLGDPIYPAVLPIVFAEGWEKLASGMEISPAMAAIGPRWTAAMPQLLQDLSAQPSTLCHGDYRADNIMFDRDGSPVLIDFQLTGTGSGAYDLAYFLTQSLEADVARDHERRLFERYVEGLRSAGVPDEDLGDELWLDYRKAALFCLVYPVVASRGMDLSDPRQRSLLSCMNSRFTRAAEQLRLDELL